MNKTIYQTDQTLRLNFEKDASRLNIIFHDGKFYIKLKKLLFTIRQLIYYIGSTVDILDIFQTSKGTLDIPYWPFLLVHRVIHKYCYIAGSVLSFMTDNEWQNFCPFLNLLIKYNSIVLL